jgi:hypothetical protein
MPPDLLIFAISLFAFIVSMIGTLGGFFGRRWKWFLAMLACLLLSTGCMVVELYRLLIPAPTTDMPATVRWPINPL